MKTYQKTINEITKNDLIKVTYEPNKLMSNLFKIADEYELDDTNTLITINIFMEDVSIEIFEDFCETDNPNLAIRTLDEIEKMFDYSWKDVIYTDTVKNDCEILNEFQGKKFTAVYCFTLTDNKKLVVDFKAV